LKLMGFGVPAPEGGAKKPAGPKSGAKVPDEIVDLVPAWGGMLLIEGFRDDAYQIPINEGAVAMRHLYGAIRVTCFDAKDSVRWQHVLERGLYTTAGDPFGALAWNVSADAVALIHTSTPGGEQAVLREVNEATDEDGKKKKGKDAPKAVDHAELRLSVLGKGGEVIADKTVLPDVEGLLPRLTPAFADAPGKRLLVECFDMERTHRYLELDLDELRK